MTGERACLARDALHQAAIAEEAVSEVVEELKALLVEGSCSVGLSNGKTYGVADALSKGASCALDHGGVVAGFGVTRGLGVELTELLEVVHGQLVAQEVGNDVLQAVSRESEGVRLSGTS